MLEGGVVGVFGSLGLMMKEGRTLSAFSHLESTLRGA